MNNLNAIPKDPKLIEAVILACLEKNPIDFQKVDETEVRRVRAAVKRATTAKGAAFQYPATRKHFLCGCLDFTQRLPEEHLIVGYGYRHGNTTVIERIHHVVGEERRVSIPDYIRAAIPRHHRHRSDAEVIVFHNHPRTGDEPEWLDTLKSLVQDLPIRIERRSPHPSTSRFQCRGPAPRIFRAAPSALLSGGERVCETVLAPATTPVSGTTQPHECKTRSESVTKGIILSHPLSCSVMRGSAHT